MKKIFIINEDEKDRILNMHETATQNAYLFEREGEQQPTTQQSTTQQSTTQQAPTQQGTTTTGAPKPVRYTGMTGDVLRIQVRMNDECPSDILYNALKPFYPSKYITGSIPNLKMKEDGKNGKITRAAFAACKNKLTKTKISGGGSTPGTTGTPGTPGTTAQVEVGGKLTANDVATIMA